VSHILQCTFSSAASGNYHRLRLLHILSVPLLYDGVRGCISSVYHCLSSVWNFVLCPCDVQIVRFSAIVVAYACYNVTVSDSRDFEEHFLLQSVAVDVRIIYLLSSCTVLTSPFWCLYFLAIM